MVFLRERVICDIFSVTNYLYMVLVTFKTFEIVLEF